MSPHWKEIEAANYELVQILRARIESLEWYIQAVLDAKDEQDAVALLREALEAK